MFQIGNLANKLAKQQKTPWDSVPRLYHIGTLQGRATTERHSENLTSKLCHLLLYSIRNRNARGDNALEACYRCGGGGEAYWSAGARFSRAFTRNL